MHIVYCADYSGLLQNILDFWQWLNYSKKVRTIGLNNFRKNPYLHMVPKSDRVKALLKRSEKSATEWEITEADTMGWRGKADANTGVFENAL